MTYFILAMRLDGIWDFEFGDYWQESVREEARDIEHNGWPTRDIKIIRCTDDSQQTIDAAIARINGSN